MIRRLLLSAVSLAFAFCAAPATSQTLTATNGSGPVACVNVTIALGETRCVQAVHVVTSSGTTGGTITTLGTVTNPVGVKGLDGSAIAAAANPLPTQVAGAVAHDGAYGTQNPTPGGCYATATAPTAVQTADVSRVWCGLNGQVAMMIGNAAGTLATVTNLGAADAASMSAQGLLTFSAIELFNGSTSDRARGDVAGMVTQPYAMTGSRWSYAAPASGLTNTTTAVNVAAAAGASVRNYITGIQCSFTALGAATEYGLRDGASGSFLWRGYVGTAGGTFTFQAGVPLKGTANTLVELVTLTASVTGAGYCNVQGYTAI